MHKGINGKTGVPQGGHVHDGGGEGADAPLHVMIHITIGQLSVFPLWIYFSRLNFSSERVVCVLYSLLESNEACLLHSSWHGGEETEKGQEKERRT